MINGMRIFMTLGSLIIVYSPVKYIFGRVMFNVFFLVFNKIYIVFYALQFAKVYNFSLHIQE